MATCSTGPNCKIVCTGGCGCVFEHETGFCTCECFDDDNGVHGNLGLSAVVSVTVKGLTLGTIAGRLDRRMAREVMVPASRVNEKVNLQLKRVPVSTAIAALGLTTRPSKRPAASPRARKRRTKR